MEAKILNPAFEVVGIIDVYGSFIWTDRFDECGDFEIVIPIGKAPLPSDIKKGYYLLTDKSEHGMIIESINIESDTEEGANFIISGRSFESVINRRIVWKQNANGKVVKTIFTTTETSDGIIDYNLQDAIELILTENIISPDIEARQIPGFVFKRSTDEKITKLTIEAQYLGEDIYELIVALCKEHEIGFKITLNNANEFEFELYAGVDRSYEQSTNPYVTFSPNYENLFNTNYTTSTESWKNVAMVAGEEVREGDVNIRDPYMVYADGMHIGLERREIFTDAGNISTNVDGGTLTADQYYAHLKKAGIDSLIENVHTEAFDGEVDPHQMYVYGVDYYMGDIVQLANEYGQEGRAYISEFIMSSDQNGTLIYPTFKSIQKGEYDI